MLPVANNQAPELYCSYRLVIKRDKTELSALAPNIVFALAVVTGISSEREPKEEGFNQCPAVQPGIKFGFTFRAMINLLCRFVQTAVLV